MIRYCCALFLSAILLTGLSCSRERAAYNPQRSAELLVEARRILTEALQDTIEGRKALLDTRTAAKAVGYFPWKGWRLEPDSKIIVTSPDGIRVEFTFTAPLEDFDAFDEIGNVLINEFQKNPEKKEYSIEFGRRGAGTAEAAAERLPERLKPALQGAEDHLKGLEKKLIDVRHHIDRAGDLLPVPKNSSRGPA